MYGSMYYFIFVHKLVVVNHLAEVSKRLSRVQIQAWVYVGAWAPFFFRY